MYITDGLFTCVFSSVKDAHPVADSPTTMSHNNIFKTKGGDEVHCHCQTIFAMRFVYV